ncbi:agamous-like MADS-box protein AGL80 [Telopea speciosissima]|uniref:agamous-like MADS-box protein AGL80 n=1 Tax=Telopea speciosissima TaxID=54955 RepID=UPI001CC62948|nr:agamous-like MADS-box protein AGL80 [Telopea speciosissima]
MGRKKIKLALIPNEAERRNTFYGRKNDIMKKLRELSTLCDVQTFAIIYSPYQQKPIVWPTDPLDAERVLNMFKSMPSFEQGKKMLSQVGYLQERINKGKDQLRKLQMENRKKEMMRLMYECLKGKDLNDLTMLDLTDLTKVVDEKIKAIAKRIEALKQTQSEIGTSTNIAGASSPVDDSMDLQVAVDALQELPYVNLDEAMPCFGNEVVAPYVDNNAWTAPFCP